MDPFSEEVARLHHEFGENLDRCRKLLQMRDAGRLTSEWRLDALISAAELSHTVRTLTDAFDGAMDGYDIPLPLLPGTVLGAQYELEPWMAMFERTRAELHAEDA